MTRTEKLLTELVALPSVNPAFAPQDGDSARPARHFKYGEKNGVFSLVWVARRAGLEVEFQKVLPGRPNLIARLRPRSKIRRAILLAPHLDTVNAEDPGFVPRQKGNRLHGRGACDTKG